MPLTLLPLKMWSDKSAFSLFIFALKTAFLATVRQSEGPNKKRSKKLFCGHYASLLPLFFLLFDFEFMRRILTNCPFKSKRASSSLAIKLPFPVKKEKGKVGAAEIQISLSFLFLPPPRRTDCSLAPLSCILQYCTVKQKGYEVIPKYVGKLFLLEKEVLRHFRVLLFGGSWLKL